MKFTESTLVQNYIVTAETRYGFQVNADEVRYVAEICIAATSDFLAIVKSKTEKVALAVKDLKGNMITAAIVEYNENEDDKDMPGNWNYYFTFDPSDIEDAHVYDITSPQIVQVFSNRAYDLHHLRFGDSSQVSQLSTLFFKILDDLLDANATEGEEFSIELEGYFVATVTVEDNEKVKSLVPDGAMKRLVKDDAAIEV